MVGRIALRPSHHTGADEYSLQQRTSNHIASHCNFVVWHSALLMQYDILVILVEGCSDDYPSEHIYVQPVPARCTIRHKFRQTCVLPLVVCRSNQGVALTYIKDSGSSDSKSSMYSSLMSN